MKFNLNKLKAKQLPHVAASDFIAPKEGMESESKPAMEAAEKYLHQFVKSDCCIGCSSQLGAKDICDLILKAPTFVWGIEHGEGFCSKCGYPARAHHDIPNVGRIQNLILQYHPDELNSTEKEAA